jgi:hypothetical protein
MVADIKSESLAGLPRNSHFIIIDGAQAATEWLHVEDPAYGPGDYSYTTVLTDYQGSGTWINTFRTQA